MFDVNFEGKSCLASFENVISTSKKTMLAWQGKHATQPLPMPFRRTNRISHTAAYR